MKSIDQQLAPGCQHPGAFGDHRRRIIGKVQNLVQHHGIDTASRPRQRIHVAMPHFGMGEAGGLDAPARQPQHFRAAVDTQRRLGPRPEQLDHPPGAGADIEQGTERPRPQHADDRRLDFAFGNVERPLPVPIRGMGGKPGIGGGQPFGADGGKLGLVVGPGVSSQRVDGREHRGGDRRLAQPHEHPGAFLGAADKAGVGQDAQMAGDARLALPEHRGNLAHRQFHAADEQQDADPARVGKRAENGQQRVHRRKDIKISLYVSTGARRLRRRMRSTTRRTGQQKGSRQSPLPLLPSGLLSGGCRPPKAHPHRPSASR